jgi:hypothetical protein
MQSSLGHGAPIMVRRCLSGIFSLVVLYQFQGKTDGITDTEAWDVVDMPEKSYFMGFETPNDPDRWDRARNNAKIGKQILLEQVWTTIESPRDLLDGEIRFRWVHKMVDLFVSKKKGFERLDKLYMERYENYDGSIDKYLFRRRLSFRHDFAEDGHNSYT